jgi:hypothetical protein
MMAMGVTISDDEFRALLRWVERERAISRSLLAGQVELLEFVLQRQLNYDRLVCAATVRSSEA